MQPQSIRSVRGVMSLVAKDSTKTTVKQGLRNSLTLVGLDLIAVGR
jgi:hypothetical protein